MINVLTLFQYFQYWLGLNYVEINHGPYETKIAIEKIRIDFRKI